MERVIQRCAGLDVHKATVAACVRVPGEKGVVQEVQTFGTTTEQLMALHDWLAAHGVTDVAMESTGVYWKPVYYVLEASFKVLLVNATHIKKVPGRKTDVSDCAWIAQLLECGLLKGSFVPPPPMRELRDLTRYRKTQIQDRAREANRLQKVLEDANIKLSSVATDVLGVSGRAMLETLVAGTTDPAVLSDLARGKLRKKLPALRQALTGRFRSHHAVLVTHILAHLDYLDEAITELSEQIEEQIRPFEQVVQALTTIPGVGSNTAQVIVAEVGVNAAQFGGAAQLESWAGLCPGNNESAGKHRSGKTRKGDRWLRQALVESANAAIRKRGCALGARYRRLTRHIGHKKAVFAVARQILEISYHLIARHTTYQELGVDYFDRRHAESVTRRCVQQLERLGHRVTLSPIQDAA
jgi:transposase